MKRLPYVTLDYLMYNKHKLLKKGKEVNPMKANEKTYGIIKQQLNHLTKEQYEILKDLSHTAKNLYNYGLYQVRQHYFKTQEYLSYNQNYKICKDNENYKLLNSNMAQQILKSLDSSFKSFFALLKLKAKGQYSSKVSIPHYLDKESFYPLLIGFVRLSEDNLGFTLPYSNLYKKSNPLITFKIPTVLKDKKIKQIKLVPKYQARFFEIQYVYELEERIEKPILNSNHVLAIDLGINNLMTCVSSEGKSFIIDGRKIKSLNQWFNKENSRLQSIKDKQKIETTTLKQKKLALKRQHQVDDYIHKACKQVISYCVQNQIGTLVLGYNESFQKESNLGKRLNQQFTHLPFGKIKDNLKYRCEQIGITFVIQDESYTSKASFWDQDALPVFKEEKKKPVFSGKRIKRGLYQTSKGILLNADLNGALNILRKSKVVALTSLYSRGVVNPPLRIRIV